MLRCVSCMWEFCVWRVVNPIVRCTPLPLAARAIV